MITNMYIPYYRGKQYDLLGLIESIQEYLIADWVIPLIEPVRDNKYMIQLLDMCVKHKQQLLIIVNPEVGQVPYGVSQRFPWDDYFRYEWIRPVYIINDNFSKEMVTYDSYIYLHKHYSRLGFQEIQTLAPPEFHIMTEEILLCNRVEESRVNLVDPFVRRKDQEYEDELFEEDEFFSDDLYYFAEDGYIGYSDYGIDGQRYYDKGYPSRYVVLHVLYWDRYKRMRVKHFTCNPTDSMTNPGQKFFEALSKCNDWYERNKDVLILTQGLKQLLSYLELMKYPGAGTVKKLLVKHHMELYCNVSVNTIKIDKIDDRY